jgi:iron complex outermembrane receptor protein
MLRSTASTRRAALAAFVVLWASMPLLAQPESVIAGQVLTHDGEPVAGARVEVVDLRRSMRTDASGGFRFEAVRPGHHHLEASHPRYGTGVADLDVEPDATASAEIVLHLDIHREEIVVTASPDSRRATEVYQPVDVLDARELAMRVQPTLGETLDQERGVAATYFGPGSSRPLIRGLGADRSRILLDGIDVGDVSGVSPDHAVGVDPLAAERVEILRGPATLLYGSGAVGGVVNVLEERIPIEVPDRTLSGSATASVGSVADERSGALSLAGGAKGWALKLDLSALETDDYEIPGPAEPGGEDEGVLENSAVDTESAALGLSRIWDRGFLGVSFSAYDTRYGIPGHGHHHEEEPPAFRRLRALEPEEEAQVQIDLEQRRWDLAGEVNPAGGAFRALKLRAGVVDYEHSEFEVLPAETELGTRFLSDTSEVRLEGVHRRFGRLDGSVGLQLTQTDLEAFGEEAFLPPSESDAVAAFVFEELDAGAVRWLLGARYEQREVASRFGGAAADRDFSGLSASLGLVAPLARHTSLSATVARAVRLPGAEELFSDGEHAATRRYEIGDPDLDEEVSHGIDLTLRRTGGRVQGELAAFFYRFDDFIYERPVVAAEVPTDLPVYAFTQDDAEFWGAELHADWELWHRQAGVVLLDLTADAVRAERTSDGQPLPMIPALTVRTGLHYRGPHLWGFVEAARTAEQDRVFCPDPALEETCEQATDGYTFWNATIGYRLVRAGLVHEIMLRGRNLTDELARDHVSPLKEMAPLPGRDVALLYRVEF